MKRKFNIQLVALMIISLPLLLGCNLSGETIRGDGNIVTETFHVDHFNSINLTGMFNVIIEPGTNPMVTLETDDNLRELITFETRNNTLYARTDRDAVIRPTRMDLHITYPALEKITIGGACKITSSRVITTESLLFDISGAASIDLDLEVENLTTSVAGAGSINFDGHASNHKVDLAGASSLNARNLITNNTDISLSGAGSAHVYATNELSASISGVGSIRYYGEPKLTNFEKSGLGSIRSTE